MKEQRLEHCRKVIRRLWIQTNQEKIWRQRYRQEKLCLCVIKYRCKKQVNSEMCMIYYVQRGSIVVVFTREVFFVWNSICVIQARGSCVAVGLRSFWFSFSRSLSLFVSLLSIELFSQTLVLSLSSLLDYGDFKYLYATFLLLTYLVLAMPHGT
jgi:hypothetical protein